MHGSPSPRWPAALAGVVAAVLAVAVTELTAGLLPGTGSPLVAVGDRVIELTPGGVANLAIEVLGSANQVALFVAMALVMLAAGALIGLGAASRPWVGPAGIGVFTALGIASGLAESLMPTATAVLAPGVGGAAGSGALELLRRRRPAATEPAGSAAPAIAEGAPGAGAAASRRRFLVLAGGVVGLAAVSAVGGRSLQLRDTARQARAQVSLPDPRRSLGAASHSASLDVDGITPLITPNDDFYRIDTALAVPRVDPATHTVRITGMVDHPLELSYQELVDLADTEAEVTLACVSNEVGGELVGTARWQGVALADVLDRAGVRAEATQIVGRAVDGWTGGFPVEAAYDGRPALVAVGMNGEALPDSHGFPVRLVVAGLYGYVSDTKWLAEIELTTFEAYDAYWIERGWSQRGPVKTQSRIDVPADGGEVAAGTVPIAGVAWAGERGVAAVEVAVDGGEWQPAELGEELAAASWRQWVHRWAAEPGEHEIAVRATDGQGHTQTSRRSEPKPDGATGHHTVRVTVA